MFKQILIAVSVFSSLSLAAPTFAADMIRGYSGTQRAPRAYRVTRVEDCDLLRNDYRAPYNPRSEIVRVCYPPLDLTPSGTRGSTGVSTTTTQSFASQ